jgi:hypothetical protein
VEENMMIELISSGKAPSTWTAFPQKPFLCENFIHQIDPFHGRMAIVSVTLASLVKQQQQQ